jgi:hypothetical protein
MPASIKVSTQSKGIRAFIVAVLLR